MKLRDFLETTVFAFDRYEVAFGIPARVSAIFFDTTTLCDAFGDYEVDKVTYAETNEPNAIQFVLESRGVRELKEYVDTKRKEANESEFKRGLDALKETFNGTDVYEYLDEYGEYIFKNEQKIHLTKDGKVASLSINNFWKWMNKTHPIQAMRLKKDE